MDGLDERRAQCYGPNTGPSNLKKHLFTIHPARYREVAKKYNWSVTLLDKLQAKLRTQKSGRQLLEYSPDGFIQYLVRWIVADDQVNIVLRRFH
jgi:hypothetical protein